MAPVAIGCMKLQAEHSVQIPYPSVVVRGRHRAAKAEYFITDMEMVREFKEDGLMHAHSAARRRPGNFKKDLIRRLAHPPPPCDPRFWCEGAMRLARSESY